jgi:hypothetical protein
MARMTADGTHHSQIGWRLEFNLDLIIALESKINVEYHTTSAYCRSSGRYERPGTSGSVRNDDSNGQIDGVSLPTPPRPATPFTAVVEPAKIKPRKTK